MKNYSMCSNGYLEEEWASPSRTYRLEAVLFTHNGQADDATLFHVRRWQIAQRQREIVNERRQWREPVLAEKRAAREGVLHGREALPQMD
jgi:hypothetical protein